MTEYIITRICWWCVKGILVTHKVLCSTSFIKTYLLSGMSEFLSCGLTNSLMRQLMTRRKTKSSGASLWAAVDAGSNTAIIYCYTTSITYHYRLFFNFFPLNYSIARSQYIIPKWFKNNHSLILLKNIMLRWYMARFVSLFLFISYESWCNS